MPPINLLNVPSRDWFDNTRWLRQHSRDTKNTILSKSTELKKVRPADFMRGR